MHRNTDSRSLRGVSPETSQEELRPFCVDGGGAQAAAAHLLGDAGGPREQVQGGARPRGGEDLPQDRHEDPLGSQVLDQGPSSPSNAPSPGPAASLPGPARSAGSVRRAGPECEVHDHGAPQPVRDRHGDAGAQAQAPAEERSGPGEEGALLDQLDAAGAGEGGGVVHVEAHGRARVAGPDCADDGGG